jgi:HPr kinase/phosphorylase
MAGRAGPGGDDPAAPAVQTVHGTCVARGARAVLIRGRSGRGKSGLGLRLLALGAELVADDRTRLWREGARLMADAPETIRGRIEARGMGILRLPAAGPRALALVVDLDHDETERLPPRRETRIGGVPLPLLHGSAMPHFPAALLLYLDHAELE